MRINNISRCLTFGNKPNTQKPKEERSTAATNPDPQETEEPKVSIYDIPLNGSLMAKAREKFGDRPVNEAELEAAMMEALNRP